MQISGKMAKNIEECPTGILVDVEETNEKCLKDLAPSSTGSIPRTNVDDLDKEFKYSCKTPVMRKLTKSYDKCLRSDQISVKNMKGISKSGWMTPSPKSMKKISNEASRIIDKLHSSPLESLDLLLCDEEFPALSSFDDALDEVFEMPSKIDLEYEAPANNSINSLKKMKSQVEAKDIKEVLDKTTENNSVHQDNDALTEDLEIPSKNGHECEVLRNNSVTSFKEIKSQVEATDIKEVLDKITEDNSVKHQDESSPNCINGIKSEDCIKQPSVSTNAKSQIISRSSFNKLPLRSSFPKNKENVSQETENKDKLSSLILFKCNKNSMSAREKLSEEVKISKGGVLNKTLDLSLTHSNTRNKIPLEKRKSLSAKSMCQNISVTKPSGIASSCLEKPSIMQSRPASIKMSSLCRSASVVETPNSGKMIRRTSSFQTELVQNRNRIKQSNFPPSSHPEIIRSKLNPVSDVAKKLATPLKYGATQSNNPRASLSIVKSEKSSRISRPSFSSAARDIKTAVKKSPPLSTFRKPMTSVSSRIRFSSRLDLPSPLPQKMSDNLARKLFS